MDLEQRKNDRRRRHPLPLLEWLMITWAVGVALTFAGIAFVGGFVFLFPEWANEIIRESHPPAAVVEAPPEQRDAAFAFYRLGCHVASNHKNESGEAGGIITISDTHDQGDSKLSDADLAPLQELPDLLWLELHGKKITDAGLPPVLGLSKLVILNLAGTSITDAGLVQLQGMEQLLDLDLKGSKVTDAGVQRLKIALPKCCVHFDPAQSQPDPTN